MARAPQRRGHPLIEHPAHREVNDALAEAFAGKPIETLDGGEILGEARLLELRIARRRSSPSNVVSGRISPGQEPPAERAIAEGRDAVPAAIRKHLGLDSALEQVIGRLQHVQRRDLRNCSICSTEKLLTPMARIFPARTACALPRRFPRSAPADRANEPGRCRCSRFGACAGIHRSLADAAAAGIAEDLAVPPFKPGLGGDDDARAQAAIGDRLADDLLRTAEAIDGRGIDEVDAALERGTPWWRSIRLLRFRPTSSRRSPRCRARCATPGRWVWRAPWIPDSIRSMICPSFGSPSLFILVGGGAAHRQARFNGDRRAERGCACRSRHRWRCRCAGAIGGTPGSPTPRGGALLSTM